MATTDFSMSFDSMESLANQIYTLHEEFEAMCANLNALVESTEGQWKGKAQVEFAISYEKLKPKLTTINKVLHQYYIEVSSALKNETAIETINRIGFEQIDF